MTVDEANKINDLYKQLDVLTAENAGLKTGAEGIVDRLSSIEEKLDQFGALLDKSNKSASK